MRAVIARLLCLAHRAHKCRLADRLASVRFSLASAMFFRSVERTDFLFPYEIGTQINQREIASIIARAAR